MIALRRSLIYILSAVAIGVGAALTACDPYAIALTPPVGEQVDTAAPLRETDTPAVIATMAASATQPPTLTPSPTATHTATATAYAGAPSTVVAPPTETPTPDATPTRIPDGTPVAPPTAGLMLDGSFEGDTYKPIGGGASGIISVHWYADWDSGGRQYPDQTTDWSLPEIVPVTRYQMGECVSLPADQPCPLVWDGVTALKVFSAYRSISVRVLQDVYIDQPGAYSLIGYVYPDQVVSYSGGKQRPLDPLSSLVRLIPAGGGLLDATAVPIGQWTLIEQRFYVPSPGVLTVGIELVGPFGFVNNGWFVDHFTLVPASQIEYEVEPGDSWWRITQGLCGDGNRWQDARLLSGHSGGLTPGQRLWVVCP